MKPIKPIHDKNLGNSQRVADRIHKILDGNVELGGISGIGTGATSFGGGNMNVAHAGATSPNPANSDFAVTHNLGRVPSSFLVTNRSAPCNVYGGGTSWTTTQIFLICDTVGVLLNFMIF